MADVILMTMLLSIMSVLGSMILGFIVFRVDEWLDLGLKEYVTYKFSLKQKYVEMRRQAKQEKII